MKYLLVVTAALLCFGNTHICAAQSESETLVDLAKQTKKSKKGVIRLSDDDLPPAQRNAEDTATSSDKTLMGTNGTAPATGSSEPASSSKASGEKTAAGKPQISDVKRLQQQVASYREQEATWNQSANSYEEKLAKETSEFRRNTYREAMENDRKNVSYFRQKIDETEAQLAKAEEAEANRKQAGSESTSDGKSQ